VKAADALFKWDDFALDLYSAERDEVSHCSTSPRGRATGGNPRVAPAQGGQRPDPARDKPRPGTAFTGGVRDHLAATMLAPIRRARKSSACCSSRTIRPAPIRNVIWKCFRRSRPVRRRARTCPRRNRNRAKPQRFHDLFENSPDAIFVESLDGTVLDANFAACVLHGLTRDQ